MRFPGGGSNPQVISRRSHVAGRKSQVAGRRSQVAGRRSQVAGRRSQVAGRRSQTTGYEFSQSSPNYFFLFPCSARGKNKTCLLFKTRFSPAGLKYRSQVTGHRSQVTGHRSQVTMKNTCKFAASSYLVGICLFRPFLT